MDEKTSCLLDRKMRRKNQILKYYVSSPKGYNKKDIRLINEKLHNPLGVIMRKT